MGMILKPYKRIWDVQYIKTMQQIKAVATFNIGQDSAEGSTWWKKAHDNQSIHALNSHLYHTGEPESQTKPPHPYHYCCQLVKQDLYYVLETAMYSFDLSPSDLWIQFCTDPSLWYQSY